MDFLKHTVLLLKRDIKIEFRQKSLLFSMIVFAILFNVILQIAFDANTEALMAIAPGILWLPILLAAMLGFNKYGIHEKENRADVGLLIAPIDRASLFLGKLIGNMMLVLLVSVISVPSFFLFLKQPYPESLVLLIITVFLGSWGFTAIGVFLSTLAHSSRISELLLPIMIFPLAVPLILAMIQLTSLALFPSTEMGLQLWLLMLIGYNVIFTVIPLLLFDILLEV
jgi:heme exporter protein B